ncbi:MAG: hypothetical protein GF401_04940 [Chitinivibrionales bacterium]|nr:hypothetical protein [Chitinivibrionales bacterium]
MFKDGIGEPGTYNHANSVWGLWYNKVRTLNDIHIGYTFNLSMLYLLKSSDTNPETYTVPSGVDGLYVEDYNEAMGSRPDLYVWPAEVWSRHISFAYIDQVSGNDTAGVIKFTVPPLQTTKFAKFKVEIASPDSLSVDTHKIKYFDTQAAAEAGSVSGSITENSHYYEFLRKLPERQYSLTP